MDMQTAAPVPSAQPVVNAPAGASRFPGLGSEHVLDQNAGVIDAEMGAKLDSYSLEAIVESKISRVLDHFGKFPPDDLHQLIMSKVEKPLLGQILRRTGGNQVHASRILGINRNTLRKKMKMYGFAP